MLELKNLDKTFHQGTINETVVFDKFNLFINQGDFVSVVGSNGSGKTTLLNLICGTLSLDGGEVIVAGKNINKMPEYERLHFIGRVYQDPKMGTCPHMTILENLSLADNKGKGFNLTKGINKARITAYQEMLAPLGLNLEDKLHLPVGVLSGGQRQALALLMATMTDLDFLILDEHTAALDPKTAEKIMQLTGELVAQKKLTTIMVTHNLRFAVDYGNRMLMMHHGKVVFDRSGQEKKDTKVEDILSVFNEISIECGN